MALQWERVGPYVKWGITGGAVGTVVSVILSLFKSPGWPGNVTWTAEMTSLTMVGTGWGVVGGVAFAVIGHLADRSSDVVRDRVKAEHKDPSVVIKMYLDIESGDETAAWHAIGLLANYRNPILTKNMLEMVHNRITDRNVITVDRLAIVRHAVKCIMATGCGSNIGQLLPYAKDMDSDIGVQVRRMQMEGVEFMQK